MIAANAQRVFLGWDRPVLPSAVEWLHEHHASRGIWDLGQLLIVVPGGRAGRRLMELLVQRAPGGALLPPSIVTIGSLPERLYEPQRPLVDDLSALLARVHALRAVGQQKLSALIPQPPGPDDMTQWFDLALALAQLDADLAAEGVRVGEVAQRGTNLVARRDLKRWEVIADLQGEYENVLRDRGLQDRNRARFDAIESQRCEIEQDVVLVAISDLNQISQRMLKQVAGRVNALIHAPPAVCTGFNELGALVVDHWVDCRIDLHETQIHVVDRPRDQALQIVRTMELAACQAEIRPDQITVGLGDEAMGQMIGRTLTLAGVPARRVAGQTWGRSRPALFLSAAARYIESRSFRDLGALLRHPDLEPHILDVLPDDRDGRDTMHLYLTMLDRYVTEHLPAKVVGEWLGSQAPKLKAIHELVNRLIPAADPSHRPLPQWGEPIAKMLATVYGKHPLNRHKNDDADVISALGMIGDVLRAISALDAEDAMVPLATAADAIRLVHRSLASAQIPPEGGEPAVELLGWLELACDDAPYLIITSVNDGHIPQSTISDLFLPNRLRSALGLADNRRRLGRDKYFLTAINHSRANVTLIACRRGDNDELIRPSQLVLASDDSTVAQRIRSFFGGAKVAPSGPLLLPGRLEVSDFAIPPPVPPAKPLCRLTVTGFRDYIACPYRFYLKHVLGLKGLDDRATEMDARTFGGLAHAVLGTFGKSDLARSTDSERIARFLSDVLDQQMRHRFGDRPAAVVAIQAEQLRVRLRAFAQWQAAQVNAGWQIIVQYVEQELQTSIQSDASPLPFAITGRIDRIDRHSEFGWRIIDYKTADYSKSPDQTHRQNLGTNKEWVDLQLPLYRRLAVATGITGEIEVGYLQLCKAPNNVRFDPADWTESDFAAAEDEALRIVGAIRKGRFWPPAAPPPHADDFVGICMDRVLDRAAAVAACDRRLDAASVGGTR